MNAMTDGKRLAPPDLARLRLEELLPLVEHVAARDGAAAAIAAYRAWIAANPASPQAFAALFNLGVLLGARGETAEAVTAYRQALALRPDFHQAAINLGITLERLGQHQAALDVWGAALQPDEGRIALLNQRGRLLEDLKRYDEAERTLCASLLTQPDQPDVIQHWTHLRQKGCLWPVQPALPGISPDALALHAGPLGALAMTDDVAMQRRIGEAWIARKVPAAPMRLSPARGYRHDRIRIGYLSSDFCRHAMSFLILGALEHHDRSAFEIYGYCSSPEDGSDIRRRVLAALDHHVPIGGLSEEAAARRIRADEIDILVDLNGLTRGARLGCLRWKPAPVQATYLGYIGPVPLPELDYLICDSDVVPPELEAAYAPRPLPLEGLYQSNDGSAQSIPAVTRAEEGLPAEAFVFCCFSNHYKITEPVFAAWLAALQRAPNAVLWLTEDNDCSRRMLSARTAEQGLGGRLIFAPRTDPARYLARLGLADVFLDTFPYNAGTVASDALRMGLPLLTLSGRSFASRMAGSLLSSIGLTEGIATSLEDYVERAVGFARDPARHSAARAVLAGDAWARSIGDSAGFTRRLEAAYRRVRLTPG